MKRILLIIALSFLTAQMFGSPPMYEISEKDVGVYVHQDVENSSVLAATVNLETGEVLQTHQAGKIRAFVRTQRIQHSLGIFTLFEKCEYLYIPDQENKQAKVPDQENKQAKVPDQENKTLVYYSKINTKQKVDNYSRLPLAYIPIIKDKFGMSSGGLPYLW